MNKIFCFGDGFATGHLWPEWPQILQALLPEHHVINTAGIGAGDEFLVSGFVDLIPEMANQQLIFQWPWTGRLDKLLQDHSWQDIISNDSVYHFNIVTDTKSRQWWLSSASKSADVTKYHAQYVQSLQHQRRQEIYQQLVSQTAANLNCHIIHNTSQAQEKFSRDKRFELIRQTEVQPSPAVHFYWLTEHVIPQLNVTVAPDRQLMLESLILQTTWIPYANNQQEIWQNLQDQLPGDIQSAKLK
jgi:hypothetical protein